MLRILHASAACQMSTTGDRAQACCQMPNSNMLCLLLMHVCHSDGSLSTHHRLALQSWRLDLQSATGQAVISPLSRAWQGQGGLSMCQAGPCASGAASGAPPAAA